MIDFSITYKEVLDEAKKRIYVYNNELRQANIGQLITIDQYNEHLIKQIISESIDNIAAVLSRYISSISYNNSDVSITIRPAIASDAVTSAQHIIVGASALTMISKITIISQVLQSCNAIVESNKQTLIYLFSHNRKRTERKSVTKIEERKKLKYE